MYKNIIQLKKYKKIYKKCNDFLFNYRDGDKERDVNALYG